MTPRKFRNLVLRYYEKEGRRHLPWRRTRDPYKILVSEVMLQQTQVERVIPYYQEWVRKFPTVRSQASAPLSDVLRAWQGLGYNRRAKYLWEAAKAVVREHGGKMPKTAAELEKLPGVGPYTARAVAAFAYNEDGLFIETNIRTAVIHHFFESQERVSDVEILEILKAAYPKGRAREWYAALMDYGSFLKRSGVRTNARAKGYMKQKAFSGSDRQARGAILKELANGARSGAALLGVLGEARAEQMKAQLRKLIVEGFIVRHGRTYELAA